MKHVLLKMAHIFNTKLFDKGEHIVPDNFSVRFGKVLKEDLTKADVTRINERWAEQRKIAEAEAEGDAALPGTVTDAATDDTPEQDDPTE